MNQQLTTALTAATSDLSPAAALIYTTASKQVAGGMRIFKVKVNEVRGVAGVTLSDILDACIELSYVNVTIEQPSLHMERLVHSARVGHDNTYVIGSFTPIVTAALVAAN